MEKVIIIAEAGVNHNGDIALAKKLVDAAVEAGVDYVKFQTFKAEKIASKYAVKAAYQSSALPGEGNSQLDMLKKLELTEKDHNTLIEYCREKNIQFLSTPFDLDSIDLLKGLGVTLGKIPSGEVTNLPFLRKMARSFRELILSTGMSTLGETGETLNALIKSGAKREHITILHCNTEYPTPMEDVNLKAMHSIAKQFNVKTGYSDHTLGTEVPIAAVALGAVVIEKHFTLDRAMPGPDHAASLEPGELIYMAKAIRNIEKALGSGVKEPSASELKNILNVRKSIVAKTDIKKGELLTDENLTTKRPGTGISPMEWDSVIGQRASRDFDTDEIITI